MSEADRERSMVTSSGNTPYIKLKKDYIYPKKRLWKMIQIIFHKKITITGRKTQKKKSIWLMMKWGSRSYLLPKESKRLNKIEQWMISISIKK